MRINHDPVMTLTDFKARSTGHIYRKLKMPLSLKKPSGNGQMDRIFMTLKKELTPWVILTLS